MIVTGTEGLSAVLRPCLVCLSALFIIKAATRGGFGDVNSAKKEEGPWCDTPAPSLTLLVGSEAWPRTVLWQVQKAWDLLQLRLSPEPGP